MENTNTNTNHPAPNFNTALKAYMTKFADISTAIRLVNELNVVMKRLEPHNVSPNGDGDVMTKNIIRGLKRLRDEVHLQSVLLSDKRRSQPKRRRT